MLPPYPYWLEPHCAGVVLGFWPWPVTAAMALNICEVMFLGSALTARVKSEGRDGFRSEKGKTCGR